MCVSEASYNKTSHLPCSTWPRKCLFSVPVCRSNQQQNTFTRRGTFQCVVFTVFCYLAYIDTEHNNTFAKKIACSKNVKFIYWLLFWVTEVCSSVCTSTLTLRDLSSPYNVISFLYFLPVYCLQLFDTKNHLILYMSVIFFILTSLSPMP